MKVIIAGSRKFKSINFHLLLLLIGDVVEESHFEVTEVVSGCADGTDRAGEMWAGMQREPIPVKRFPAEWRLFGKSAGPRRNHAMAEYADALIAIWDGKSRGTANMIQEATAKGLKVFIKRIDQTKTPHDESQGASQIG